MKFLLFKLILVIGDCTALVTFGFLSAGTKIIGTKPISPRRKSNALASKWKKQQKATWLQKHWTGIRITKKLFLEWYTFSFVAILILPLLNVFRELKTVEDYRKRLNAELLKNGHDVNVRFPDGYQEAPLAYDAVWAVALGKNESLIN